MLTFDINCNNKNASIITGATSACHSLYISSFYDNEPKQVSTSRYLEATHVRTHEQQKSAELIDTPVIIDLASRSKADVHQDSRRYQKKTKKKSHARDANVPGTEYAYTNSVPAVCRNTFHSSIYEPTHTRYLVYDSSNLLPGYLVSITGCPKKDSRKPPNQRGNKTE